MSMTRTFLACKGVGVVSAGVALLLACVAGCGPGKPAVGTYVANVKNVSPAQCVEDGQQIARLFAELAVHHGLTVVQPLPSDTVALYFPSSTGLNLSFSAINMGPHAIAVTVMPVNMGHRDNASCRKVIDTVDQKLQKIFTDRLQKSM